MTASCILRTASPGTGSYLSAACEIPEGSPLAYLIAPPLESMYALDKALKAAQVRFAPSTARRRPPTLAAALLTGSQSDCQAACDAFARAVIDVAANPIETLSDGASS